MKYGKVAKQETGYGKQLFFSALLFVLVASIIYYYLKPLDFDENNGCPKDTADILHHNIMIVDTTDAIREGKRADIELLIREFTSAKKPFRQWLEEEKKADLTSIFLLTNTAPLDMQPVIKFCTQPPTLLLEFSNTEENVRKNIESINSRISNALDILIKGDSAAQSPIIEALNIITSSPSYWVPGSTLVLVSDLMQNTKKCGFFDVMNIIPSYSKLAPACLQEVRILQENLRPKGNYTAPTVVAICELPSNSMKPGKTQFWQEIFQDALKYDVAQTCDPKIIDDRRVELVSRQKKEK